MLFLRQVGSVYFLDPPRHFQERGASRKYLFPEEGKTIRSFGFGGPLKQGIQGIPIAFKFKGELLKRISILGGGEPLQYLEPLLK